MVVLNFYDKIEPICISKKLGLYISNLPNEKHNNWESDLAEELELALVVDRAFKKKLGKTFPCQFKKLFSKVLPEEDLPNKYKKEHFKKIAEKMICIYQDYSYSDMPLGGWDTNCFDGRLCEEDYSEKIIDFINFLAYDKLSNYNIPFPTPQWTYSSNHDEIDHYRIFWGGESSEQYIQSLKRWGEIFDNFLQTKNEYLLFDYLVNSIYKDHEYNEYHLMKAYSLCQLFLEKERESELDFKLPQFLDSRLCEAERQSQAKFYRKMRNKIAHGDFLEFENIIEEYAVNHMDDRFSFDYSEYSRKNWVIIHACCDLDDAVRQLVCMAIFDNDTLKRIKG